MMLSCIPVFGPCTVQWRRAGVLQTALDNAGRLLCCQPGSGPASCWPVWVAHSSVCFCWADEWMRRWCFNE